MSFSVFFKSLSRFPYRFFQKKKSFCFFLWLWTFFVAYSMVAVSFFIAFSLSLQKVYRFFIVASDDITPTQGIKKPMRQSELPFVFDPSQIWTVLTLAYIWNKEDFTFFMRFLRIGPWDLSRVFFTKTRLLTLAWNTFIGVFFQA